MVEMLVGNIQTKTGGSETGNTVRQGVPDYDSDCFRKKSPEKSPEMLCLSARTVSTYRMRILKKLCLKGNAELVQYYIQNHLSELK